MRRHPWLLYLALPLLMAACERRSAAPGTSGEASSGAGEGKIRIAMMPKLIGIDYFNACRKGAEEAAGELKEVHLPYDRPTQAQRDKPADTIHTPAPQRA